jgi:ribosomal protein L7/L12
MKTLQISGWKPGLDKIALTKIIRIYTGLGLAEAKRRTDDILENKPVVFRGLKSSDGDAFLADVRSIGAVADVSEELS